MLGCRWCAVDQASIGKRLVVEHKAQTHLRGFAVVSLLVGASCPDAHMYRSGADVRHMLEGEEKQHNPALSGTMHPQAAPASEC